MKLNVKLNVKLNQTVRVLEIGLLWLLLLAHVLAAWTNSSETSANNTFASVSLDALIFCQTALLLGWAILGPFRWWLRGPLILLVIGFSVYFSHWTNPLGGSEKLLAVLATQAAIVATALLTARLAGYSLQARPVTTQRGNFHFSIRSLMILTAVVAVGAWSAQWAHERYAETLTTPLPLAAASLGAVFAIAALLAFWAVLRPGYRHLQIALASIASISLGPLPCYVCGREGDAWMMLFWSTALTAIMVATLLVVRAAGYRLVRLRSASSAPVHSTLIAKNSRRATPSRRRCWH